MPHTPHTRRSRWRARRICVLPPNTRPAPRTRSSSPLTHTRSMSHEFGHSPRPLAHDAARSVTSLTAPQATTANQPFARPAPCPLPVGATKLLYRLACALIPCHVRGSNPPAPPATHGDRHLWRKPHQPDALPETVCFMQRDGCRRPSPHPKPHVYPAPPGSRLHWVLTRGDRLGPCAL